MTITLQIQKDIRPAERTIIIRQFEADGWSVNIQDEDYDDDELEEELN